MSAETTPGALAASADRAAFAVLARREIGHYLRSWPYLVGAALCVAMTVVGFIDDDGTSSVMTMILPATTLGLLGMVVMSGLARRSDAAAEVAGAVAVGESTRTWALVCALVVPFSTALVVYTAFVVQYVLNPPAPGVVPFGPVGDSYVLAVMFALSVVPALGGPLVGLVVARWLPFRGATALVLVLVVLITIVMQGNFEATWEWQMVWPWTYWYGPLGWSRTAGDAVEWLALPGSPLLWIGYLVTLCALGVVAALLHDPEADRGRLRRVGVALVVLAAVLLVATMTMGLPEVARNPLPGPAF